MFKQLLVLTALFSSACATLPKTFSEPMHTKFTFICIAQGRFLATSCECQERVILKYLNGKEDLFTGVTPGIEKMVEKECVLQYIPGTKQKEELPQIKEDGSDYSHT